MPKPPVFTAKKIVKILEKNGFVLKRSKGSHRIYRNPITEVSVVVPYHAGDIPKGTVLTILKDAGISF